MGSSNRHARRWSWECTAPASVLHQLALPGLLHASASVDCLVLEQGSSSTESLTTPHSTPPSSVSSESPRCSSAIERSSLDAAAAAAAAQTSFAALGRTTPDQGHVDTQRSNRDGGGGVVHHATLSREGLECSYSVVQSTDGVAELMDVIDDLPTYPPAVYVDFKGCQLGRCGDVAVLTVLIEPQRTAYLLDVVSLGAGIFDVAGSSGLTVKRLLESSCIPKVMFDVRSPCDALFGLYGIHVHSVYDVQLMEWNTRRGPKRYVKGLAGCVEQGDAALDPTALQSWSAIRAEGRSRFNSACGGSEQHLRLRPIAIDLILHCLADVVHLGQMWRTYRARQTARGQTIVEAATKQRVACAQSKDYIGQGPHMALAPSGAGTSSKIKDGKANPRRFGQRKLPLQAFVIDKSGRSGSM